MNLAQSLLGSLQPENPSSMITLIKRHPSGCLFLWGKEWYDRRDIYETIRMTQWKEKS